MKKAIVLGTLFIFSSITAVSAQTTLEITPNTNYQTKGNATVTADGTRYRITAKVDSLPAQVPNNGRYYILWATIQDGRADNLGTVSNNQELSTTVNGTPKQIFVTAERDRFPEYVQGPRLAQSREINPTELTPINTPAPTPSRSPGVGGGGTVGQPNDAPETGLGGTFVLYAASAAMITFGSFGALMSLKKSAKSK